MAIRRSDIRLIDGDVATVTGAIKKYLSSVNFKIEKEELEKNSADIKACNLQRSFIKLYISNSPQIVHLQLIQKNAKQVQIEITGALFEKFRVFYYIFLTLFLTGFDVFAVLGMTFTSTNKMLEFMSSAKLGFVSILFLFSAGFFIFKSLEFSPHFSVFRDNLFSSFSEKNINNEIHIKDDSIFPELWKTFFLFCISLAVGFLFMGIEDIVVSGSILFYGPVTLLSILVILLIVIIRKSRVSSKMTFLLVGFELCISLAVYMNAPIFIVDEMITFFNNAGYIKGELENPSPETINNLQHANMSLASIEIDINTIILIVIFLILFSALLSALLILSSTIRLPVKVLRNFSRFKSSRHQDSYFQKALEPKESSIIFSITVFALWQLLAIANITGLFLSLSVFVKTFFGIHLLFKSALIDQFLNGTKFICMFFFSLTDYLNDYDFFHKIIMFIFCSPALMFIFLVLKKNIKSISENYSLIKNQPITYGKISSNIKDKLNGICKSLNINVPMIQIVDSSDINAETRYLGFPFFKHILIISKGTWDELHTAEDELDILLAHEIWHIKKHTLTRKFLCFLSDYSLFGNGFLALLQNSFKVEKKADDFAIMWLTKKYNDKNRAIASLKNLLERIEEIKWKNAFFTPNNSLNFTMLKEPSYRNEIINKYDKSSRTERIKISLKILYQMYFGTEILSYFHPSNSQRISWVEGKYGTNETT